MDLKWLIFPVYWKVGDVENRRDDMKRCTFCGGMISDAAKFCEHCGAPVGERRFLSKEHYLSWREMGDERRTKEQKAEERAVEEQPVMEQKPDSEENGAENRRKSKPAQPKKSRLSGKKKWIALAVCAVLVVVFAVAWRLSPMGRFDRNLFENIPLTSAEEITTWLDDNGYEYEELGERGNGGWLVRFESKRDKMPVTILFADRSSSMNKNYRLNYEIDIGMKSYLSSYLKHSYREVTSGYEYCEDENLYYLFDDKISRLCFEVND